MSAVGWSAEEGDTGSNLYRSKTLHERPHPFCERPRFPDGRFLMIPEILGHELVELRRQVLAMIAAAAAGTAAAAIHGASTGGRR